MADGGVPCLWYKSLISACNHVDCWNCPTLKAKFPEVAEVKWRVQMLRPLWTLLVLMNTCSDHRLGKQAPEETTFGTDYSNLLGEQLQKEHC